MPSRVAGSGSSWCRKRSGSEGTQIRRIVPNVSSRMFEASRDFYIELFGLVVSVELDDWYLQLMAPNEPTVCS